MRQDLFFSLRALRRRPRLVFFIVVPLALGIGANAAIFTVVEKILLAPLAFPDSEALYTLHQDLPKLGGDAYFSAANYLDLLDANRSFSAVTAMQAVQVTLTEVGDPTQLEATRVTPEFFEVFKTMPVEGRRFQPEEVAAKPSGVVVDQAPLALLSHELWTSRFGSDTSIIGKSIRLNDTPHEVVGVMPEDFHFPGRTEIWVPLVFGDRAPVDRGGFYLHVNARLADGVSPEQAEQNLGETSNRIAEALPEYFEGMSMPLTSLKESLVEDLRLTLWILFAISGLMLIMICANVAHLLLAQATSREREMAVRLALGSGPGPVIRQLLAESLLMAWLGCALGLILARLGLSSLLVLAPPDLLGVDVIELDATILLFAFAVATLTAFLFGLGPALYLSKVNLRSRLGEGGRGSTGSHRQKLFQAAMVTFQLALAVLLVNATTLMIRSYNELKAVELGFEPANLVTVDVSLPDERYGEGDQLRAFTAQVLEQLEGIPGVKTAGAGVRLPLLDNAGGIWFQVDPELSRGDDQTSHPATFNPVTPEYFEAVGMNVRHGRGLTIDDRRGGMKVAVVNESLAERFFGDVEPIGQEILMTPWPDSPWRVVGVTQDVRQGDIKQDYQPAIFVPYDQVPFGRLRFVARTEVDPKSVVRNARDAVWRIDPTLGIETADIMDNRIAEHLQSDRFSMTLIGLFGALGLLLAATGVYGSTSYFVRQRMPEFGIRQALGGRPQDLVFFVFRSGLRRGVIGLVGGLAATFGLVHFAESVLYEISPYDPWAIALTIVTLFLIVMAAMLIPAIWAGRVSPASVLHYE